MQRPSTAPSGRRSESRRDARSGKQGHASAPSVSLGPKWPPHLVPLCVDERTTRQFPFVLDVAHLANFAELRYYARPQLQEIAQDDGDAENSALVGDQPVSDFSRMFKQRTRTGQGTRFEYTFRPHEPAGTAGGDCFNLRSL